MAKPSKPADYGLEAGTILLGKYRVDSILGHGGMGIVAQATHLQLEERVAIKFLRDDVILDAETMQRFQREARNAVKLKGEHVARVIDVGEFESGVPYMVMEFLEGIDLGQMLQESGKINPSLAVELLLQACVALAEAHSLGIVHRDIKPGNLFVTWRADGSPLLKILDFGISKAPVGADINLTQTQSLLGTPAYMSPEQMRSARTVDPRSDIWSLGTVLFEIIQGRRPFEAESFSEMCVKVAVDEPATLTVAHPAGLDRVILRALEKDAADRYQTIAEMARDLVPFARDRNSALVAVERMGRMLGRVRAAAGGFDRSSDLSSPDALPRGMRDARSQAPVTPEVTDVSRTPVTPRDRGDLHVGDVTDHDVVIDGEATAITTLDAGEGTRTKLTAIHEDGEPDTAQRGRVAPADSGSHRTIEDDLSWADDKPPWTPQSTTAQTGATTDPSLPSVAMPPSAPAELDKQAALAAQAQAAANASAAAQAHAAARSLALQKARSSSRAGGGTIPMSPTGARSEPFAVARATPPPTAAQHGPGTAQYQGIGVTLPGLFPAAIPSRPGHRPPTPVHGTPSVGATALLAATPHPVVRPVATLRAGRAKLVVALLLLGGVLGAAAYLATVEDDAPATPAPAPAPAPVVDPSAAGSATPVAPTPTPAVPPPTAPVPVAPTPPTTPPAIAPVPAPVPAPAPADKAAVPVDKSRSKAGAGKPPIKKPVGGGAATVPTPRTGAGAGSATRPVPKVPKESDLFGVRDPKADQKAPDPKSPPKGK